MKNWKNVGKVVLKRGSKVIESFNNLEELFNSYHYYRVKDRLVEGDVVWASRHCVYDQPWAYGDRYNEYNYCFYLQDISGLIVPLRVIASHYGTWKGKQPIKHWRPIVEYRKEPVPGTRNYGGASNHRRKMQPYNSRISGGRIKQKRIEDYVDR